MQFSKDIAKISKYFRRRRNQYMEPFGLKGIHARLLADVFEDPGISQDKLAQRLCIDKSNVARHVAFLEENGFLERRPSREDKRVLCLYVTDKTRELLPGFQKAMNDWEGELLAALSREERGQLLCLLRKACATTERED